MLIKSQRFRFVNLNALSQQIYFNREVLKSFKLEI